MVVKIYVKSLCGKTISINLPIRHFLSIKVLHLKWKIESLEGIPGRVTLNYTHNMHMFAIKINTLD